MDDFLSLIQFRTAMPFGYLFFFLFWLYVGVWSIKKIYKCLRAKEFTKPKLYIAATILLLNLSYMYSNVLFTEALNFNPFFKEADVVGKWIDGESSIELLANGQVTLKLNKDYEERLHLISGSGSWYKEYDFNIIISNSSHTVMRVIKYNQEYRMIVDDYGDPDAWDGSLGFKLTLKQ